MINRLIDRYGEDALFIILGAVDIILTIILIALILWIL